MQPADHEYCRPSPLARLARRRRRAFVIGLIVFQAFWLNVVLPGHTRGIVTLPGTKQAEQAEHKSCCQSTAPQGEQPRRTPTPRERACCAICYLAARVTPPESVDLTPPPLRLLEYVSVSLSPAPIRVSLLPTYDGRAPPAA